MIVLAPAIVVRNWEAECRKFLPSDALEAMRVTTFDTSTFKSVSSRVEALSVWHEIGGLLLMGYEMFRTLVQSNGTVNLYLCVQSTFRHMQRAVSIFYCMF